MCSTNKTPANLKYGTILIIFNEAGQLQHTGGPHNLLGTRMTAANVYTYIKGEGEIESNRTPLFTDSKLR
jgi:hypothetical protein